MRRFLAFFKCNIWYIYELENKSNTICLNNQGQMALKFPHAVLIILFRAGNHSQRRSFKIILSFFLPQYLGALQERRDILQKLDENKLFIVKLSTLWSRFRLFQRIVKAKLLGCISHHCDIFPSWREQSEQDVVKGKMERWFSSILMCHRRLLAASTSL